MTRDTLSNVSAAWRRQHIDAKTEVCDLLRDSLESASYAPKERRAFQAALNLLAEAQRSPAPISEKRKKKRASHWLKP